MNKIVERIEQKVGVPGLAALLAERLPPTDLQSLLLEVYRLRSARRTPVEVLASYESDRFVRPAAISPQKLAEWEQSAISHLPPGFEALVLSPVCPLGTASVIAGVSQDWAVATARNTEVVSDSTNVLALECAFRRKQLLNQDPKSATAIHLAASHRLLRAQKYADERMLTHFSLFALCSAGRGIGFELEALGIHIRFYLNAFKVFLATQARFRVTLTDFSEKLERSLMQSLLLSTCKQTGVEGQLDPSRTAGKGYYPGLCFHIYIESGRDWIELADGGGVDWAQKLLGNAKERLVISGTGIERLIQADFNPSK